MKLQPLYSSPFDLPGFFAPISRREAAQLLGQWRRNGTVRRVGARGARKHGYSFCGPDGEDAAMALNDPR